MDIRGFFQRNNEAIAILLSVLVISSILGFLYLSNQLFPEEDTRYYRKPDPTFPLVFNKSKPHNFEKDYPHPRISTEIWGKTEFQFFSDYNGGMTGSRMLVYNDFFDPDYDVAIVHHLYVIALLEYQIINQNEEGDWIETGIITSWEHPNESIYFLSIDEGSDLQIVSGNLIFSDEINGSGYSWLDLGQIYIGSSGNSIKGFNLFSIPYAILVAYETYLGKKVLYNDFLFTVKKIKRFVVRDDISWQILKDGQSYWQTIFKKTYYLGNSALEGSSGYENNSGIILTPYPI